MGDLRDAPDRRLRLQPSLRLQPLGLHSEGERSVYWSVLPRDLPTGHRSADITFGEVEHIDRYRNEHPDWFSQPAMGVELRKQIKLEVAHSKFVGEPIDVLWIKKTGARWVDRPADSACAEIALNTPPAPAAPSSKGDAVRAE